MKASTIIIIFCLVSVALGSHQLRLTNNCTFPLWPTLAGSTALKNGTLAKSTSIVFGLASKRANTLTLSDGWVGRITASIKFAQKGGNKTDQVDQKSNMPDPLTTVEIKLDADGGLDFYHITLEEGFNVPVSVGPLPATFDRNKPGNALCQTVSCAVNLNRHCPPELAVTKGQTGSGDLVVGCRSACSALGGASSGHYCCGSSESTYTPENRIEKGRRCRSSEWKVDYPQVVFKAHCPQAYSYAYDDSQSTYVCMSNRGEVQSKVGYGVLFCP